MAAQASPSHWNAHAARWRLVGPPLRPCPADIAYLKESAVRLSRGAQLSTALLLGVTPEIAEMVWDPPLELLAIDKSEGMVRGVWPGDDAHRHARLGDWLAPLREAPFDLVMGDGVFSIFDYPAGYTTLAAALAELVKPGGLLSVRLFCRLEPGETLDEVWEDLFAARIGNFNVFKWRLAMALQGDATRGVRLADIWTTFRERATSPARVAQLTGWPEPVVATIEGYRNVDDRYSFSTEREVVDVLATAFQLVEVHRPDYELGERCPHLSFRRRA